MAKSWSQRGAIVLLENRGEKIWRFLFVCGAFLPIETCRRQASERGPCAAGVVWFLRQRALLAPLSSNDNGPLS